MEIDEGEWYVCSLSDKVRRSSRDVVDISEGEYAHYEKVMHDFDALQDWLQGLYQDAKAKRFFSNRGEAK